MKKTALILALILAFASCIKTEISFTTTDDSTLYARIEQDAFTKTSMDADKNIRWSENDQVVAFMKSTYGHKYQVKPSFVGKVYADFSKVSSGSGDDLSAGLEYDHNIVYYPYSESVECEKSGSAYVLNVVLPTEQTYVAGSFSNGSFPMVAVSEDNNITFRNVCGGMKLQLKGTQKVTTIRLEGRNNEKLSGAAIVTAYTDETKPVITMGSGASTSATLNCGKGVQLSESTATEFIIALPPVLFSKGFTVTVTDTDGKTYTVETDKANTVLRSSLLAMPVVVLNGSSGEPEVDEDELIIPVSSIMLTTFLDLYVGYSALLEVTVKPDDATDKTVTWISDTPAVASVDQSGNVTAISVGTACISASAGGKSVNCAVTVSSLPVATADYVDEYGVNHGKGTAIGMAVWAPVNCGYKAASDTDKGYTYGKLYQWGRKYGQGYSGELFDVVLGWLPETSDASVPVIVEGGVPLNYGQYLETANHFYYTMSVIDDDWAYPHDPACWNLKWSGTSRPVKNDYDPCPEGWRVPTCAELDELRQNKSSWTTNSAGQYGFWFSGASAYTDDVPQVFFPAAGSRSPHGACKAATRGCYGEYWSSIAYVDIPVSVPVRSYNLHFDYNGQVFMTYSGRAYGYSVRCVQE